MDTFRALINGRFNTFPGEILDTSDLPEELHGQVWKNVGNKPGRLLLFNPQGDVVVAVHGDAGWQVTRLEDAGGLDRFARLAGFEDRSEFDALIRRYTERGLFEENLQEFIDENIPEPATREGFLALLGPDEDIETLDQDVLEAALKYMALTLIPAEADVAQAGTMAAADIPTDDLHAVFDIADKLKARGHIIPMFLVSDMALLAARCSDEQKRDEMIEWVRTYDHSTARMAELLFNTTETLARERNRNRRERMERLVRDMLGADAAPKQKAGKRAEPASETAEEPTEGREAQKRAPRRPRKV